MGQFICGAKAHRGTSFSQYGFQLNDNYMHLHFISFYLVDDFIVRPVRLESADILVSL